MRMTRFIAVFAVLAAASACTAERTLAPQPSATSVATTLTSALPQVPLLFVVDGIKLQRDQVPSLSNDEILKVQVVKGRAALKQFGPDAAYGVVVITTRHAAAPRS
jgi:hypothetical protein